MPNSIFSYRATTRSAFAALAFALAACSGGGGGGSSPAPVIVSPPPPPPPVSNTWQPGVFQSASLFKDECEFPRSGTDIEGNPFPDLQGTLSDELFWLRSWTNETYLWPDEVEDQDPNTFDNPVSYFNVLRTNEVTASGEDKDDFHFSEPTEDFLERRTNAASASYGVSYIAFSTSVPRDFRVRYTEPNSPASDIVNGEANFIRGARILEVDGVDLVNGSDTDTLNAGLFPATAGESHTFVVQDPGSNRERTITLVSENLSSKPVNRTAIIDNGTSTVGYILFNTFSPFESEREIVDAMNEMQAAGVDDLVLDLRYNGGGLLAIAAQTAYMIAGGAAANNKTFELLQFNPNAGNRNPVTGEINDPVPFFSTGVGFTVPTSERLPQLNLNRVFILSTERTCSASEAVINGLRGIDVEIVLIGATTCGKPYGFYPTDNCGETYYTIQFQGVNDKGEGGYSDGFTPTNSGDNFAIAQPGCTASDDLNTELGDASEGLLRTALSFQRTGVCPVAAEDPLAGKPLIEEVVLMGTGDVATTSETPADAFANSSRDVLLPGDR